MGCAPSKESSKKGGVGTNQSIGALHERVTLTRHTEGVNIWDSYEIVENIAQGSTCEVFTIRQKSKGSGENHKKDTTIYVCKQISKEAVSDLIIAEMRNELSILQRMDHPNIVRVYETFENKRFIYLVMECMSGGDLFSRKGYTEGQAAKIMTQVTSAIAFCHQNCVIHRDLKMENIMFDNKSPDSDITVIDFGLSANYIRTKNGDSATMKDKVGTMYTIAPEVLRGEYNQKADMWSIGVVAFILLSGKQPFEGETNKEMATNIYKAHYSLDSAAWKNVSPEAKKFVSSLLQKDPKQRPSASKALQSPWLMKEYNLKDRAPNAERMQEIEEGLIKSRQASKFQKLACMMIAYRMPAEQLKELRAAFDAIDTSNEGTITYDEFRAALKDKHDYSHAELKQMFNALDENQNGVINYTEFLSATLLTRKRHEDGSIRAVFDKIDKDNTGLINREELKSIIVDQSTTEDAEHLVDEVLESMDKDHDGKISYDEFLSLFNEKNKM